MRILFFLSFIVSFQAFGKGESHALRNSLDAITDTHKTPRLTNHQVHFEILGWYKKYVEPGIRGEKSFSVKGDTDISTKQQESQLTVKSQGYMDVATESDYWSLETSRVRCHFSESFSLDLSLSGLEIKTPALGKECSGYGDLLAMIFGQIHAPFGWFIDVERQSGPSYIFPDTRHKFLYKLFETTSARQKMQWTVMRIENGLLEMDMIGDVDVDGEMVRAKGKVFWDVAGKYTVRYFMNYEFSGIRKFPEHVGRLTSLSVRYYRFPKKP